MYKICHQDLNNFKHLQRLTRNDKPAVLYLLNSGFNVKMAIMRTTNKRTPEHSSCDCNFLVANKLLLLLSYHRC